MLTFFKILKILKNVGIFLSLIAVVLFVYGIIKFGPAIFGSIIQGFLKGVFNK